MKKKFYIAILILFIAGSGYMIYSVSPRKFQVKDVSSPESFKLYQSGKPESVELAVMGQVDSAFTIRVVGLPGKGILFDSTFRQKRVDFTRRMDYYEGRGIAIFYAPEGTRHGQVKLSARINAAF